MVTIRITSKVASKLKVQLGHAESQSTGKLGDWYVNLLIIKRQHLLLAVSERTLLPIVMPARDLKLFPLRLSHDLELLLQQLGVPKKEIEAETREMLRWTFAKTASRQVLGSMNDFANLLDAYVDDGAPLLQQSLRLGRAPCRPLGMDNPLRATAALFGMTMPPEALKFVPEAVLH